MHTCFGNVTTNVFIYLYIKLQQFSTKVKKSTSARIAFCLTGQKIRAKTVCLFLFIKNVCVQVNHHVRHLINPQP